MCGIFGYNSKSFLREDIFFDAMKHRGPDAHDIKRAGQWSLGHLRLSIIDTSAGANQPFVSGDDTIVFNGEIYNYLELKEKYIKGMKLRTTSDTEVLLELLRLKGVDILRELNGMFAFAWYNTKKKELILCRDRFGVKPLHWLRRGNEFFFASEIKPLVKIKGAVNFNLDIVKSFLIDTATDFNEQTQIEGIFQIPPGHYLVVNDGEVHILQRWYHNSDFSVDHSIFNDYRATIDHFERLLVDSIKLRHRSDVPVAITLSGGLDSTTIYALTKEHIRSQLKPFTFAHPGSPTDESQKVHRLTQEYGDEAIVVRDNKKESVSDVIEALSYLEFPIWSASGIGYLNMYKALKKHGYKVVIEGHGSDEQFGGYPYMIKAALREALLRKSFMLAWHINVVFHDTTNPSLGQRAIQEHTSRRAIALSASFLGSIKEALVCRHKKEMVSLQAALDESFHYKILPIVLRTFDRMTMSQSIESRCPFMDYRIVEFIRALPLQYKVNKIGSKALLREILKKYNKDYIYKDKKKMGFASDVPSLMNDEQVKKLMEKSIKSFSFSGFEAMQKDALVKVMQPDISWADSEVVWKIASLEIVKQIYEHY